jgi:hypothetical protein
VTLPSSVQAMDRRVGRGGKDLASRRRVGAGSIGAHVVAAVHAAIGAHVVVVVRVRASKSEVVVVVAGEIRWVDRVRNGVHPVVASIQQRLPRRLPRDDGGQRRGARRLDPRSTLHKAFEDRGVR